MLKKINLILKKLAQQINYNLGKCKLATASYWSWYNNYNSSISKRICNNIKWWFDINPTLIDKNSKTNRKKNRLLNKGVSKSNYSFKKNC